ncbi:25884_t:CDS:1 [Gigaspora margarita]|uniref:25884_t:CDS:1 n=1 Tax=Gigaspora margarita TaxID=4874 RepID=A0ABN7UT32_GIGMA|nr:25884_t:CDS:1 [Gigaspora margarita]
MFLINYISKQKVKRKKVVKRQTTKYKRTAYSVAQKLEVVSIDLAVIPGGLTSICQPLDVAIDTSSATRNLSPKMTKHLNLDFFLRKTKTLVLPLKKTNYRNYK